LDPSKLSVIWIFQDEEHLPDLNMLMALARSIHQFRSEGKNVLVHCQAGRNRSGLVVGTALAYDGFSGSAAVKRIKGTRGPEALSNDVFRSFVENL